MIRNRWLVLALLTLAYTLAFMDRYLMNLLLEPVKHDLSLTDTQVSLLAGASFAIFYALMGVPLGRLSDRTHRVRLIASGIFLWSLMTSACALARNYLQLLLSRVGVGVGEAALTPCAYSILSDYFPSRLLGTAIGLYSAGIYLGSGLAYILGGALLRHFAGHWQKIFLCFGIPGLAVAALVCLAHEPERSHLHTRQSWSDFLTFLKADGGPFLLLCAGAAVFNVAVYATGIWIPTFLTRVHQLSLERVGLIVGLGTMLLSPMGALPGGRAADALAASSGLPGRLSAIIGCCLLFVPACLVYTLAGSTQATLWALVPYGVLVSTGVASTAATVQEMVPGQFKGTAAACLLMSQNLVGMGLGPTSVGLLTDQVFHDPLALGRALALVSLASLAGASLLFLECRRRIVGRARRGLPGLSENWGATFAQASRR